MRPTSISSIAPVDLVRHIGQGSVFCLFMSSGEACSMKAYRGCCDGRMSFTSIHRSHSKGGPKTEYSDPLKLEYRSRDSLVSEFTLHHGETVFMDVYTYFKIVRQKLKGSACDQLHRARYLTGVYFTTICEKYKDSQGFLEVYLVHQLNSNLLDMKSFSQMGEWLKRSDMNSMIYATHTVTTCNAFIERLCQAIALLS